MFKKVIFIAFAIIFCATSVNSEVVASFSAGVLMQQDQDATFGYAVKVGLPAIAPDSAAYEVVAEAEIMYSDRAFNAEVGEIEAIKVTGMYKRELFSPTFYFGVGAGIVKFTNTSGDDKEHGVAKVEFGASFVGIEAAVGGEVYRFNDGPDMYYPYAKVKMLTF